LQVNRISQRISAGAAALQGKLYIFGGNSGLDRLNDLQVWDPKTSLWSKLNSSTPGPTPREGHGLASVESSRKLYVLGGITNDSGVDRISSDFFEFDIDTSEWNNISHLNTISARSHFGFTSGNEKLYLFGGILEESTSCALYEFNTALTRWKCASAIESSGFQGSSYIMPGLAFSESRLYISGGLKSSGK
jgi:N-acetylneuraminic acid mutarotase